MVRSRTVRRWVGRAGTQVVDLRIRVDEGGESSGLSVRNGGWSKRDPEKNFCKSGCLFDFFSCWLRV